MGTDPRLENYLSAMERVLKPFPVSDRADIVTEIKSHVLSALERDPKTSLDSVLSAIGAPEQVANRYLMERGLKPTKPPISPVVKWLVIGFLGSLALLLLFVSVLLIKFSPLFTISERDEKVTIMGGLIDIDGKKGTMKFGDSTLTSEGRIVSGSKAGVAVGSAIAVEMSGGTMTLGTSLTSSFSWKCRTNDREVAAPALKEEGGALRLILDAKLGLCDLELPPGSKVSVKQEYGELRINRPRFHLSASLGNGKVGIFPDSTSAYVFDTYVARGTSGRFESSPGANAFNISIKVENGMITREGTEERSDD